MDKFICYVFGLMIVLLFSIEYFKRAKYTFSGIKKDDEFYAKSIEPLPAERLTNRPIYFLSFLSFVIFSQVVFFSLTMTLNFFAPLIGLKGNLPQESLILASALLTIGFLPNMPFLQEMIRKTRAIFLRAARVPLHGRLIFNILYGSDPEYNQEKIKRIINDRLYDKTVLLEDFEKPDIGIDGLWAKIVYLYFSVDETKKDPSQRFSLRGNEDTWNLITVTFKELCPKIEKYKMKGLKEGEDYNLYNQLRVFLYQLYTVISSGIVMTYKNHPGYASILKHFGYTYDPAKTFFFSMKRLLFMSLACALGITFGAAVSSFLSIYMSDFIPWLEKANIIKNLKQFLIYGIPFTMVPPLCVLLIKRFMSENLDLWHTVTFENAYKRLNDRPWNIYIYVGFFSYFIGIAVLMLLKVFFHENIHISQLINYGFIKQNMAWPIFSAIVCVFVAIRSDTPYFPEKKKIGKTLIKETGSALFMGLITLGAVFICFDLARPEFVLVDLLNWDSINPVIKGRLFSYCIMGFCIGFFMSYTTRFKTITDDRRKHPRFKSNTACTMKVGGYSSDVKFKNISVGGVSVSAPKQVAIEKDQIVTISLAPDYQFDGRIVSVKKRLLSISFNQDLAYDTINSIINFNRKRMVHFSYAGT